MNEFYDLLKIGFNHLFSSAALPLWALIISFFAILSLKDIRSAFVLLLSLTGGILVNLLLLNFRIFTLQNQYWTVIVVLMSTIFALWNFSFQKGGSRKRGSSFSSRYLVSYFIGMANGVNIHFLGIVGIQNESMIGIMSFSLGLFFALSTVMLVNFIFLWTLINFLRVKEQSWLLVVTGISIGMSLFILLNI